jgi:diguanylate cyclase (GGDEF)-like protein
VLDDAAGTAATAELAGAAAAAPAPPLLLACVDPYTVRTPPEWLRAARARVRALVRPVDRWELAAAAGSLLNVAVRGGPEPGGDGGQASALGEVFERYRRTVAEQLDNLDRAGNALAAGTLDTELRIAARRDAHKLVGSAGTFGFAEASDVARELEVLLERPGLDAGDAPRAAELMAALRRELATALAEGGSDTDAAADERSRLLVVEPDPTAAAELAYLAGLRGLRAEIAPDPAGARAAAMRNRPDVVVVDTDSDRAGVMALLRELGGRVPALIRTGDRVGAERADRAELARLGGRGFLPGHAPPERILDAAADVLARLDEATSTVLVIDDDPTVLALVRTVFEPAGLRVVGVGDPLSFWETLTAVAPDLIILDIDLPSVDGIQLCRVVRGEPRWAQLPVLFLTARTDADTVQRVYAAGADDFVTKPLVGLELVTRVSNRLERVQLFKRLAETDGLTGVANRRRAEDALQQLERLAARYEQPLAVALLDLDGFKQVNDRYGHEAGDQVLRRLASMLRRSFRGEDIVARWGGEEFLVGMYGMTRDDGVHRLAENLEALRAHEFKSPDGVSFRASFSAGVAQLQLDGGDLQSLYRRADEALYRAKESGRDRVLAAGPPPAPGHIDVVLAPGPGSDWDGPLELALATRGYLVRRAASRAELDELLAAGPGARPLVAVLEPAAPAAAGGPPGGPPGGQDGEEGRPEPVVALLDETAPAARPPLLAMIGDESDGPAALAAGADGVVVVAGLPASLLQRVRRALRVNAAETQPDPRWRR